MRSMPTIYRVLYILSMICGFLPAQWLAAFPKKRAHLTLTFSHVHDMGKLKPQGPNVKINHGPPFPFSRCLEELLLRGPQKKTINVWKMTWNFGIRPISSGIKKMSVSGGGNLLQMIDVNLTVRHKAGRVYKTKKPYIHFPTIHRMAFSENSFRLALKTSFFQQLKPTCPPS